jgi:hypothetical protein
LQEYAASIFSPEFIAADFYEYCMLIKLAFYTAVDNYAAHNENGIVLNIS